MTRAPGDDRKGPADGDDGDAPLGVRGAAEQRQPRTREPVVRSAKPTRRAVNGCSSSSGVPSVEVGRLG